MVIFILICVLKDYPSAPRTRGLRDTRQRDGGKGIGTMRGAERLKRAIGAAFERFAEFHPGAVFARPANFAGNHLARAKCDLHLASLRHIPQAIDHRAAFGNIAQRRIVPSAIFQHHDAAQQILARGAR